MVSTNSTLLHQKITEYLADMATQKTMIAKLTAENNKLKKEVSHEKSMVKKLKEEKQQCMDEINSLKDKINQVSTKKMTAK